MTPTDNLEAGAGDLVERSEVNRILQEAFGKDTATLVLRIADLEAALDQGPSNPWRFWSDKANTLAAQLSAVTAENARLREALEPFAQKMDWPLSERDAGRQVFCKMTGSGSGASFGLSVDGFRRARAVLSQEAPK